MRGTWGKGAVRSLRGVGLPLGFSLGDKTLLLFEAGAHTCDCNMQKIRLAGSWRFVNMILPLEVRPPCQRLVRTTEEAPAKKDHILADLASSTQYEGHNL